MSNWTGKTPTPDEMRTILEAHSRWTREDPAGSRANLARANLTGADLRGADLRDANLTGADLRDANLRGANLRGAYLRGASLRDVSLADANLARADLRDANLTGAYLRGAYLRGAYLRGAYLADADLARADLTGADLRDADLTVADLTGAYLRDANLTGADLRGANLTRANDAGLIIARTRILPGGALIGWKKCENDVIVKLRIPEAAKRSHAFGRKCRAEYVEVLEVIGADIGHTEVDGHEATYRVGETVRPHEWCEDFTRECAGGIHFFITREEAEAYSR